MLLLIMFTPEACEWFLSVSAGLFLDANLSSNPNQSSCAAPLSHQPQRDGGSDYKDAVGLRARRGEDPRGDDD